SIYMVGESMAEVLTESFPSIDAILAAKPEELARAKGFGPKRAQFVYDYFHSPAGEKLVKEFRELGLKLTQDKKAAPAGGLPLAGKTVVVTGALVNYDRVGIETAIKEAGGKASGSVSKKTDFVLGGDHHRQIDQPRPVPDRHRHLVGPVLVGEQPARTREEHQEQEADHPHDVPPGESAPAARPPLVRRRG